MTRTNREAERALIGACLISGECAERVLERVSANDFDDMQCRNIYNAIKSLVTQGMTIDIVTLSEELTKDGKLEEAGGVTNISTLVSSTPNSYNYESYIDIVLDNAIRRDVHQVAAHIADTSRLAKTAEEALAEAERAVSGISRSRSRGKFSTMEDVMAETMDRLALMQAGGASGVSSGIAGIDSIVGGWQRGDLVIVAARPSVGKTALATTMAANAAFRSGKAIAIFSLEMSREQIGSRMLSSVSGIGLHEIRHGQLDLAEMTEVMSASDRIKRSKIFVEDAPIATPGEMKSKCRRLKKEHGLDLVVVDYLQLMSPDRGNKDSNRVYDVAEISRGLKALARELDVPVVALSQLSRSSEYRENNEPKLSDLRDSGAIEQDADVVLMLWRSTDVSLDVSVETVHCKVAKHRNGPTGRTELMFNRTTATFKGA